MASWRSWCARSRWLDFNAWCRLEGSYRFDESLDAYKNSLPDSQMRSFIYVFEAAVNSANEYNQSLKTYKATADEMDWSTEVHEPDPEPEEADSIYNEMDVLDDSPEAIVRNDTWSNIEPRTSGFY